MSGDVTYQALKRLTWLNNRDASDNGNVIAGQEYDDVYFTGGTITGATVSGNSVTATGATTAQTLADRFGQIKSVLDFGAVAGDSDGNATINTAAFQAAQNSGGAIHVPAGTFVLNYITMSGSCVWYGDGVASVIKKKSNSIGTSYSDQASYLFNITSPNIEVEFKDLLIDCNYQNQTTTNAGAICANTGTINNYNASATVMGVGGFINASRITSAAATDRLICRVNNCKIQNVTSIGIYWSNVITTGAYAQLIVEGNEFFKFGASISEYHDGSTAYDGIVYPASGYSFSATGINPSAIYAVDGANIIVTNNSFMETRDQTAGTITTGYDINTYNMPGCAVVVTYIDDATNQEWTSLTVSNNYFKGMGRTYSLGNGIGVVDMYARGGGASITGNRFENCYESPIRGKSNGKNITITGNVIDTIYNGGLGINVSPATVASQLGNIVISGNIVKSAGAGIIVTGSSSPPENSNSLPDDSDNALNNVVISNNVLESLTCPYFSNAVLQTGLAFYGYGIGCTSISELSITGNIIKTTATSTGSAGNEHGIYVRNCIKLLSIQDNLIKNVVQSGILVVTHTGSVVIKNNSMDTVSAVGVQVSCTGESDISGNTIKSCGSTAIVGGNSSATKVNISNNIIKTVAGNSASSIYGIQNGGQTDGTFVCMNNTIDGVANSGAGVAYGIGCTFVNLADTNTMIIDGNTISSTDESGIFATKIYGKISNNVFKTVNTSTNTAHGGMFLNGTANVGYVQILGNTVDAASLPYPTTGGASGTTMRTNAKIHEGDNSWQSKQIWYTAAPTVGTWAVGDMVWNSTPASAGFIGWVCTTAGTSGTWKTWGVIS